MGQDKQEAGKYTLAEILSQPQCWTDCLRNLEKGQLTKIREQFGHGSEWLFIGCGSSYYLGMAAAATWTAVAGLRASAVPASEVLLFPDLVPTGPKTVPVLISRSGQTSETLRAAEYLEHTRNLRTLAVSCAPGRPLAKVASACLCLPDADEKSTVMTRSFTSMLLALQLLATSVANKHALNKALQQLPNLTAAMLAPLKGRIGEFVSANTFADYVFLGQGPFYGLASESMLKVKEMSCSYAQVFHTLEFRHGPKAIITPEVLVTFLLSEVGYEAELEVLEELKQLGAKTLVVTNAADPRARAASDLLVELAFDIPEYARLAAYMFTGHLLGLLTGLKKGLDPDKPRYLSRAVVLGEEREKPEHAAH